VECEKLGTLLDLLLCREYKKKTLIFRRTSCFFLQDPFLADVAANMGCSANFGINWQFVWTVQPVGQRKVRARDAINALTQDFLPSYDKLLVALCPILESILPRTAPEQPNTARIFFFSVDSTPHLAWKPKLHYPVHDFIWSHFIPLSTPTPYCYKIHFNIIIPEVACWFFHYDVFLALRPEPTLEGQVLSLLPGYLEAVSSVGHLRTRVQW